MKKRALIFFFLFLAGIVRSDTPDIQWNLEIDGSASIGGSANDLIEVGSVPFLTISGVPCAGEFTTQDYFEFSSTTKQWLTDHPAFYMSVEIWSTHAGAGVTRPIIAWSDTSSTKSFMGFVGLDGSTDQLFFYDSDSYHGLETTENMAFAWHTWQCASLLPGAFCGSNSVITYDGPCVAGASGKTVNLTVTGGFVGIDFENHPGNAHLHNLAFYAPQPTPTMTATVTPTPTATATPTPTPTPSIDRSFRLDFKPYFK